MSTRNMFLWRNNENNIYIVWLKKKVLYLILLSLAIYSVHQRRGWSGVAKVSCILCHRGVQLILAYSWARPAILVAGRVEGNVFISSVSSLSFLFLFLPCSSLSSPLLSLLALSLGDNIKWPTRVDVSLNPNAVSQSINQSDFNPFWTE